MTDLYKALFAYETDKEDELALSVGETVHVTNKENADWWLAERLDHKDFGLVPSNFLEQIKTEQGMILAIVKEDYVPEDENELLLQKNDVITILEQQPDGHWKGDLNGKTGLFPSKYVQLLDNGHNADDTKSKNGFKLAAYGVKQGGIGSILAGGFAARRRSSTRNSSIDNTVNKQEAPTPSPQSTVQGKKAMVIHDYAAQNEDEIKLIRGEYITNLEPTDTEGWWKGANESGTIGVFPSNFVQVLEEEAPPQRPARTRPATVKSETNITVETALSPAITSPTSSSFSSPNSPPPPVPVTTRPTSLLTNRENSGSTSSISRTSTITAPPRPITSPPIPGSISSGNSNSSNPNRSNSVLSTDSQKATTGVHKRTPSIPLVSPDLPPVSPTYERPTRPLPRPTSTNSSDGITSAVPEKNHTLNMAKPPKVAISKSGLPIPPRPSSINDRKPTSPTSNDNIVTPKRTMPPLLQLSNIVPFEDDDGNDNNNSGDGNDNITKSPTIIVVEEEPGEIKVDSIDQNVKKWVQLEIEKLRKEFTLKLEEERNERLKLETELNKLKNS